MSTRILYPVKLIFQKWRWNKGFKNSIIAERNYCHKLCPPRNIKNIIKAEGKLHLNGNVGSHNVKTLKIANKLVTRIFFFLINVKNRQLAIYSKIMTYIKGFIEYIKGSI